MCWFNSGAAIDPKSPRVAEWLGAVAARARRDATARSATVRSHFKGKATGPKQ